MTLTRRLFAGAFFGAGLLVSACGGGANGSDEAGRSSYETESDHAIGNADAPVVFVEYASVACPHCATWHESVYPTIEEHVESGDVRFVFREMITGQPQLAVAGFMLARCAPEERYFDVLDILFEQQRALFTAMQNGTAQSQLVTIARSVGLSEEEFLGCMQDESLLAEVQAANQTAVDNGITATPSFVINGDRVEMMRAPEGDGSVFAVDGDPIEDADGTIPAEFTGDAFDRIIAYFKARAES